MNKTELKIVTDAKGELEEAKEDLSNYIDKVIGEVIDPMIESIGNLQENLQGQYDDLSDKQQEGDKGTKLKDEINALEELKDELDTFRSEFDDSVFDDLITKCEDVPGVVQ
jgi:hypothetical protein